MPDSLKGFVPIHLRLQGKHSEVTWIDASNMRPSEPFFFQTIQRVTAERKCARVVTNLDAILELSEQLPDCEPDGFIFHTSRCGSTLVCNALKAAPLTTVVAEAQPISVALVPYAPASIWPFPPETWERGRDRLVRAITTGFGQMRATPTAPFYIKFNSWNTLALHIVKAVWPKVKWVFLYRDPIEILVSNLRRRPSWLQQKAFPKRASAFFGFAPEHISAMSVEEFGARVIARYYSNAVAMADEHSLLMDYKRLNADGLRQILDFLGINRHELQDSSIDRVLRVYSKDRDGRTLFVDDSEEKQSEASLTLRRAVDRWANNAFAGLEGVKPDGKISPKHVTNK
jgi:hypothetical protein